VNASGTQIGTVREMLVDKERDGMVAVANNYIAGASDTTATSAG